jgi:hypothetical protein
MKQRKSIEIQVHRNRDRTKGYAWNLIPRHLRKTIGPNGGVEYHYFSEEYQYFRLTTGSVTVIYGRIVEKHYFDGFGDGVLT